MEERITALEHSHMQMFGMVSRMEAQQDGIVKSLDELKHSIMGNGQPGALDKFDRRISVLESYAIRGGAIIAALMMLANVIPVIKSIWK